MGGKDSPGGGERKSAPVPFGERYTEFALKRAELHRDSRRSEVQLLGDGGDRPEALQRGEHPQLPHIKHKWILALD